MLRKYCSQGETALITPRGWRGSGRSMNILTRMILPSQISTSISSIPQGGCRSAPINSAFHGPLKDQGPLALGSIYVYNLHTHKSLRMTWRMTWAVALLLSQSVRSWSTALSQRSPTVSSTWARSLYGASSSGLSHRLLRYV